MKEIAATYEIINALSPAQILKNIEAYARVCYKSEDKATEDSAEKFIAGIIKSGHESVIEHEKITVRIICDRGVSHELVRHRIASYSQESTRYCNYAKDKFGGELTFIKPCFWEDDSEAMKIWRGQMAETERMYLKLIQSKIPPEEARTILPNSLKTEIIVTMNLREWRHFFRLRTSPKAHPQMREIAIPLLAEMRTLLPVVFGDI
ncbi:thymidylate synthase [Clostridia bacterium]|nr:thymidylate synthase [Clostridia bacterium]